MEGVRPPPPPNPYTSAPVRPLRVLTGSGLTRRRRTRLHSVSCTLFQAYLTNRETPPIYRRSDRHDSPDPERRNDPVCSPREEKKPGSVPACRSQYRISFPLYVRLSQVGVDDFCPLRIKKPDSRGSRISRRGAPAHGRNPPDWREASLWRPLPNSCDFSSARPVSR